MRGRVTFTAAGQEHALRFTTNRLCQLEEDTGENVIVHVKRMEDADNVSFLQIRQMFRAGLEGEHSLQEAGDIIDAIGTQGALVLLGRAFGAAFESGAPEKSGGKPRAGRA